MVGEGERFYSAKEEISHNSNGMKSRKAINTCSIMPDFG